MTTTVSEIRVWAATMTTDRELLEYACREAANAGGSFSIEYLGTQPPDNFMIQRYTINWPDYDKKEK